MTLLSLLDIEKQFDHKPILNGVNLSINKNDIIAIIGKNGSGKSTLLNIIAGDMEIDAGERIAIKELEILSLPQHPSFESNHSVRDVLENALSEIKQAHIKLEDITLKMTNTDNTPNQAKELESQYAQISQFIDDKNGWDINNKIEEILLKFNLKELQNRLAISLSGGEQKRLALAKMLLKSADILLLDEPTNHLDMEMVEFLEEFINKSKFSIVFISHDRYFIENIASFVVEVEDGKIRSFQGGYSNFLSKKEEILKALSKEHDNMLKLLKREEEWLHRGVRARAKRNEGRKERVMALREKAKINPSIIRKMKVELDRSVKHFNRDESINAKKCFYELENIELKIGDKILIKDLTLRILQGQKIGIIGKNGSGKSSFLKMLLGENTQSKGVLKVGDIKIGYFDQHTKMLDDSKNLLEIFCPSGGDHIDVRGKHMHVYGYMKNFLFPKEFLDKKIGVLSGGEKSRVALALLLSKDVDILILDEPTNDLDIATINILEEYLLSFNGSVIFVSHDRFFVDKIADKILVFEGDGSVIESYMGFSQYYERLSEIKEVQQELESQQVKKENIKTSKTPTKLSYQEKNLLEKLPVEIQSIELEIQSIESIFSDPSKYSDIASNAAKLDALKSALEEKLNLYITLEEKRESLL